MPLPLPADSSRHPLGDVDQEPAFENDLPSAVAARWHALSEVMTAEPDRQLFEPTAPNTKPVVNASMPLVVMTLVSGLVKRTA